MSNTPPGEGQVELRRTLGAVAITVYAIGDILGAGIYALVGKVVALAGAEAWISFLFAGLLAVLTGLTYAELSARLPRAAGAAAYCRHAFSSPLLAFLVGVFVLASGVTSAAAVSRAFVGYLVPFFAAPQVLVSFGLLSAMTLINHWGIQESARLNFVLTFIEFSGLVLVMVAGFYHVASEPLTALGQRLYENPELTGLLGGVTIAFYAFIGFEDTVNLAEEVRNPSWTLPRAILIAIAVTSLIYVGVTVAALLAVPHATLASSDAPLLDVLGAAGVTLPPGVFAVVAMVAIGNTGLLNLIMASRLLYGMANEGLLPARLGRVHPVRRTPTAAVLVSFALAAALAASGGAKVLAQTTSLLLICVFAIAHAALLVIKRREPAPGKGIFTTPRGTPVAGALLCGFMAFQYPLAAYARALPILAVGVALYYLMRRRPARRVPDSARS